ncbi:MAG TPA: RNA 2',3'-cyclic phosphodiesterase [Candidatus Nanoarchaeia archaeon]|nr:RNA 2',3'-cyclic phosphodiesterase [Candidatus Nanoarchaeia archaeon]
MRLFIAVDFEALHAEFQNIQDQIDPSLARMSKAKTYHLTLKFLGDTDTIEDIQEQLKKITFEPFTVRLDTVGVFPDEYNIKVIWVGIKPEEQMKELQKKVEDALPGFKQDYRFHPHITLARVKDSSSLLAQQLRLILVPSCPCRVHEFKLVQSVLTLEGPRYRDIQTFS